jgi:endonuclease YncB( thermonuclease family)
MVEIVTIAGPVKALILRIAVLAAVLAAAPAWSAATRSWATLTNCQYIAAKDNDGDSFRIRSGTNEYNVRLYFVDAPELNLVYPERTREQSEYFGVTLDDTLRGGREARDLVASRLKEPFIVRTRWASAAGRAIEPRFYTFVQVGTNELAEILIRQGLAQPKGVRPNLPGGEKAADYQERLLKLEVEARKQRIGLWSRSETKKPEDNL